MIFENLLKKKHPQNLITNAIKEKPIKPIIKAITEFPAKILLIDNDNFDNYQSAPYLLRYYFAEEIDNNLYEFYLARNFIDASKQIRLFQPDLILCELVVPPVNLVKLERNAYGHGLKIFEVLKLLNLSQSISVIFWAILADRAEYREKAMELGAIDCIERNTDKDTINQGIRKALGLPEKLAKAQALRQSNSSINNLQDTKRQITQKSIIYQNIKAKGIEQGQVSLILMLLKWHIGEIELNDEARINQLSIKQLGVLGEALLDFSSRDDLVVWLNR